MKRKLYVILYCFLFTLTLCSCSEKSSLVGRDYTSNISINSRYNLESSCAFCKIILDQLPSTKVYEDEHMLIFQDKNPRFRVHLLAVPKKHISSLADSTFQDKEILGYIQVKIAEIVKTKFSTELKNGFRVHTNSGDDANQTVKHLHYHITGGEKLPLL